MKLINNCMLFTATCLSIIACNSGNQSTAPYEFIIDAGSSGSRIYVYNKLQTESGLVLNSVYESKLNIPLASFANNTQDAGVQGVQPLLTNAINFVQANAPGTPIRAISTSTLGTAGMRLIPESQQIAIYQSVSTSIVNNGLQLGETKTITGQYEGLYSWVDINYLQNNFRLNKNTQGVLEIGGASAQVAFATTQKPSESVISVEINHKAYNLYSVSFLGLGQDVARNTMDQLPNHDACYMTGYNSILPPINGDFNFNSCTANYNSILKLFPEIDQIKNVPGYSTETFIGVASVYYALHFWNIESQPILLSQNINVTCNKNFSEVKNQYPSTSKLDNQCANSTYINSIVFDSLAMGESQLTAVEKINNTTLSWTLGYALMRN